MTHAMKLLSTVSVAVLASVPASAQWAVYDHANFIQNTIQVAREAQQINNQIQSLHNEVTMLANMDRDLQA